MSFLTKQTFLFYDDQVQDSTVTSTGTWDPSLQNVKDRRLQKIALNDDGTASVFIVFPEDVYIGGVAVLNTNVNYSSGSYWALFSDAAGTVPVGSSGRPFIMAADTAVLPQAPRNIFGIAGSLSTPQSNLLVRSIRMQLVNLGEAVYIGRIYASRIFWSDEGAQMGSMRQEIRDPSTIVRSIDGTPYVMQRELIRATSVEWHALDDQEAFRYTWTRDDTARQSLYVVQQLVGGNSEVILMPAYRSETNGFQILDAQSTYGLAEWGETDQYEKSEGEMLHRKTIKVIESR